MAIRSDQTTVNPNPNETLSKYFKSRTPNLLNTIGDDFFSQDKYDFSYLTFPNDIGTSYNGHYMVININVRAKMSGEQRGAFGGGKYSSYLETDFSTVDNLRGYGNKTPPVVGENATQSEFTSLERYSRRISQSIALFMPNTMVYNTQHAYEDISLTALVGTVGVGGLTGLLSMGGRIGQIGSKFLGSLSGGIGAGASAVAKLTQTPINPKVEVVYATTPQRQFIFEFLLVPRNEAESATIWNIVKTLRFHSAPELSQGAGPIPGGLNFYPPAEFDIAFYNMGRENTAIPRINTCVLERIEVDHAPTGMYATHSNGFPVATRLSLAFREIEILHKLRVLQGY